MLGTEHGSWTQLTQPQLPRDMIWIPATGMVAPRFHKVRLIKPRPGTKLDALVEVETPFGKAIKWVASNRLREVEIE